MKTLLVIFLAWIGSHTSYDVSQVVLPQIEFHTQEELNRLYYQGRECKEGEFSNIVAFYTKKAGGTGYFNKKFNEKDPEDQAVLFHEIVHHVQYVNKTKMPKTAYAREVEAITLENIWRIEHGIKKIDRRNSANLCR